jgi:hypothetical protein
MLAFVFASAQQTEKRKQFQQRKLAFIKQQVGFTAEEEKAFLPLYSDYSQKRRAASVKLREIKKNTKQTGSDYEAFNNLTVQTQLEDARRLEAYYQKLKQILPAEKIYKLFQAEKDFKKQLLDKVSKKRQ